MIDYSKTQSIDRNRAFEVYCSLQSLDLDDQKFCYNTDTARGDIFRLLDMGADEYRVCKKVKAINPDFCTVKSAINPPKPQDKHGVNTFTSAKRGIIYM